METVLSIFMLIFGLAFFVFCMQWVDTMQRRDQDRTDHRNDLAYHRVLQERREFGYDRVEEAITSRSFLRNYKLK